MAVRKILIWPNFLLEMRSVAVHTDPGKEHRDIPKLIEDMKDTLAAHNGWGLAAVQVGVPVNVMVLKNHDGKPLVLVNPEVLTLMDEPRKVNEGCLSLPGFVEETLRHPRVSLLQYFVPIADKPGEYKVDGHVVLEDRPGSPVAQAFQHELEHFEGKMLTDKLTDKIRRQIRDKMKEQQARLGRSY